MSSSSELEDAPIGAPPQIDAELRALVERLAGRRRIPHVAMAVERGDGAWQWTGAAGQAGPDGEPMRSDTPYFIASVTKLYIATCVLQLYEEGRVGLDQPMAAYLPDDLIGGLHRRDGVDRTGEITIGHLLSHTSGLPDYLEDAPKGASSRLDEVLAGHDQAWAPAETLEQLRSGGLTPHFPPQQLDGPRVRARYSDTNFQLLIAVIEAATGQPVHDVFAERLFGPLGLERTYLPGASRPADQAPAPAAMWHGDRALDIPRALPSFRDLISTAGETMAFLRSLQRGELFADPATLELMRQRWNRIQYVPLQYGMGLMRLRVNRLVARSRRPVSLLGHSGASGSWAFWSPELDIRVTGTIDQWGARAVPFRILARVLRSVQR